MTALSSLFASGVSLIERCQACPLPMRFLIFVRSTRSSFRELLQIAVHLRVALAAEPGDAHRGHRLGRVLQREDRDEQADLLHPGGAGLVRKCLLENAFHVNANEGLKFFELHIRPSYIARASVSPPSMFIRPMGLVDQHVGSRIRQRRERLALTVEELACLVATHPEAIAEYERGTSTPRRRS